MALAQPSRERDSLRLGVAAAKAGDKKQARWHLLEAARTDPQVEVTWLWLASVVTAPDEAIVHLERALRINPSNPRTKVWLRRAQQQARHDLTKRPTLKQAERSSSPRHVVKKNKANELSQLTDSPWRCPRCEQSFVTKPETCTCCAPRKESPAAVETIQPKALRSAPVQSTQPTVLVVDDSPTIRQVVSVTLAQHGYRVLSASGGIEALALLQETAPGLILLDITMPRLDGYKVCRIIKNIEAVRDVPIVFFTGRNSLIDKVRARAAGGVKFLKKPIGSMELIQVVAETCQKSPEHVALE